MDFDNFREIVTLENILEMLEEYRSFGPIPGMLLPMLEAFLPILPLFIFVMANAAAFGLWLGFIYSWLGACTGALIVFFLVRKYGQKRLVNFIARHRKMMKLLEWVERHGFGPLFIMLCFPFTPSSAINVVAGLSRINTIQFILAVLCGKLVMVFTVSFIGHDIRALFQQPARSAIVAVIIAILWFVGKQLEIRLTRSTEQGR